MAIAHCTALEAVNSTTESAMSRAICLLMEHAVETICSTAMEIWEGAAQVVDSGENDFPREML